jgi:hypothetical protein
MHCNVIELDREYIGTRPLSVCWIVAGEIETPSVHLTLPLFLAPGDFRSQRPRSRGKVSNRAGKGEKRGKRERIAVVLDGEQDLRVLASLDVCLIFCEETPPEARNERDKLKEKGESCHFISRRR